MACVAVGATCGLWENAWPWYCLVDYLCATGLRPTQRYWHFEVTFKQGTYLPVATGPCRAYQQPSGLGGANPPPSCRTLPLKKKPCKTRRTRPTSNRPQGQPQSQKKRRARRARRARRVQGTMGEKGGWRGHAERESQVPTVALTPKTPKPHKNNPGNGFGNPKNPQSQHFPTGETGDARRPREP